MDVFQAAILGVVQGVTEYIPVSSSAHLVLVPRIFGWEIHGKEAFVFDILVQLGTLVGILVYFYRDVLDITVSFLSAPFDTKNEATKTGWFIILATIPAAVIGLLFKNEIAAFFDSPDAALIFLMVTGGLLVLAEWMGIKTKNDVGVQDALSMGLIQTLALFPGISRSGATISTGMLMGLNRAAAAKFSFLMSIPVMLGAALVALRDMFESTEFLSANTLPIVIGFITSAISGYLVIKWLLNYLKNHSLYVFAGYCWVVGIAGLMITNF